MPPTPERRFSRSDLAETRRLDTLSAPSWRKAHVFTVAWLGETWVVKDFERTSWLYRRLMGRIVTARELRALDALRGLPGVPVTALRIDANALAYPYLPGESIRQAKRKGSPPDGAFFGRLEELVKSVHGRGIVHLDLRNASNLLRTPHHEPLLVDFQSSVRARYVPRWLWRLLEEIDFSGVYKWWDRMSPATFDDERAARLRRFQRLRVPLDAIHAAFNHEAARKLLTRLRLPLALAGAAAACWLAAPEWFAVGLALSAAGALLQLWCFASISKQKELAVHGPYKFVRNPMYLARFVLILGFVTALGRPWLIALYSVVYYFYAVNRVKREERKLLKVFGVAYEEYTRRVHRFLPISSYPGSRVLYGRMDLLLRNNGHWNVLGVAAFWALLYATRY